MVERGVIRGAVARMGPHPVLNMADTRHVESIEPDRSDCRHRPVFSPLPFVDPADGVRLVSCLHRVSATQNPALRPSWCGCSLAAKSRKGERGMLQIRQMGPQI